jgi:hypothetical protein
MGTIGNINLRVGTDLTDLTAQMKLAQNTIANFKDNALNSLRSFGLPHLNSTDLVESIQSGQRTIANFSKDSNESMGEFQTRVRSVFEQVGVDISGYEKVLESATSVQAKFTGGTLRDFQVMSEEVGGYTSATMTKFSNLKETLTEAFTAIGDSSTGMATKLAASADVINTLLPELFALGLAVLAIDKLFEAGKATMDFAANTQDAQRQFSAAMGGMSDDAEQFSKKLSDSYGVDEQALKKMLSKEYMNMTMQGFDPKQAEGMSEGITQLSYDLGKLRGVDPSDVFQSLQMGLEGQTRGLKSLGIEISAADLKQRALSEGIIKQGQTMTDAQTALMAYQAIMAKAGDATGYYATQADTLSNRQARVDKDFEQMKRTLADALIPAMTEFKTIAVDVEEVLIGLGNALATYIKYVTLFDEDVGSVISDLFHWDFSNIGQQFQDNIQSAFYSTSTAANEAATSNHTLAKSTNDLNKEQEKLGKTLKDNLMSFDEIHNITQDAGSGGGGGMPGVMAGPDKPTAPNVPGGGSGNDNKKGVFIPIAFGPMPPFPPIPPIPPVVQNWAVAATAALAAWSATSGAILGGWETVTELGLATWATVTEGTLAGWSTVTKGILTGWETLTELGLATWATVTEGTLTGWATLTELGLATWAGVTEGTLAAWALTTELILSPWAIVGEAILAGWALVTNLGFEKWASSAGATLKGWAQEGEATLSTWGEQFETGFSQALNSTETLMGSWASKVGQEFDSVLGSAISGLETLGQITGKELSNIGDNLKNWTNDHQALLGAIGTGIVVGGATIATGGLDLIPAAVAGAGAALSTGFGEGALGAGALALNHYATGGIAMSPQVATLSEVEPEAVIPLSQIDSVLGSRSNTSNSGNNDRSSQPLIINVTSAINGRAVAKTMHSFNLEETDRQGLCIGYPSGYNYPR